MIPLRSVFNLVTARLFVFTVILLIKVVMRWNEVFLWMLAVGGPILFLVEALCSNIYLVLKPLAWHLLIPKTSYKKAFIAARKEIAKFWLWHGRLFHCHEIVNFDRIPEKGGALLVFYHGAIPIDYVMVIAKTLIEKNRLTHFVVDKMMILTPGLEMMVKAFGCHSQSREGCIKMLKKGHLIGVAPGGGFEAQLGTNDYKVLWKSRQGFAAVAYEAQVPIIPIFTENIREAFVNMHTGYVLWEFIYRWTRIPVTPIYGNFPVKLRTHVGEPIKPQDFKSVSELRQATLMAMETLISNHQIVPGNIIRAVKQRVLGNSYQFKRPNQLLEVEPINPSTIQIKIGKFEKLALQQNNHIPQESGSNKRIYKKLKSKTDVNFSISSKKDIKQSAVGKEDLDEESSDSSGIFSMDLSE